MNNQVIIFRDLTKLLQALGIYIVRLALLGYLFQLHDCNYIAIFQNAQSQGLSSLKFYYERVILIFSSNIIWGLKVIPMIHSKGWPPLPVHVNDHIFILLLVFLTSFAKFKVDRILFAYIRLIKMFTDIRISKFIPGYIRYLWYQFTA